MSHLLLFSASLVEWYAFPHKNCQVLQRVYWRMHCPLSSLLFPLFSFLSCVSSHGHCGYSCCAFEMLKLLIPRFILEPINQEEKIALGPGAYQYNLQVYTKGAYF